MVSNACHATDQKRRAAVEQGAAPSSFVPTLRLSTRRQDETVQVRIRDNGSGMPPEVVEKIFNPFFTTKPANQGTGLGLAISNDIVRQHGGTISVISEPDQFTEMTVELPFVMPAPQDDGDEDADADDADEQDSDDGDASDGEEPVST